MESTKRVDFLQNSRQSFGLLDQKLVMQHRPVYRSDVRWFDSIPAENVFRAFDWLEKGGSAALVAEGGSPIGSIKSDGLNRLGVWSSGTTGEPKLIWHDWAQLKGMIKIGSRHRGELWATPYRSDSFAFVHLCAHVWANSGCLVKLSGEFRSAWAKVNREKNIALACTPTYAHLLLLSEEVVDTPWQPSLLTLGGEPLRESLGIRLAERFRSTRLTVIYATTELGLILKTNRMDGWYEMSRLSSKFESWRIVENVLEVKWLGEWRTTGDVVNYRESDDAIKIVGRADPVANVGGAKICLAQISDLAANVPGVIHALAFAEPSAVSGEIVALKYSIAEHCDNNIVREQLAKKLRESLPKSAWPRKWERCAIGLSSNAKALCQ